MKSGAHTPDTNGHETPAHLAPHDQRTRYCLYRNTLPLRVLSEQTHVWPLQQPCLQLLEAIRGEFAYEALSHIYLEQLFRVCAYLAEEADLQVENVVVRKPVPRVATRIGESAALAERGPAIHGYCLRRPAAQRGRK